MNSRSTAISTVVLVSIFLFSTMVVEKVLAEEVQSSQQVIQDVVKKYLQEKTKISGTLDLFDDTSKSVRNLRVIEMHPEIKSADNLFVVPIDYRDIQTGAIVNVEISVEKSNDALSVKSVEIKKVTEINAGQDAEAVKKDFSDAEVQDVMKKYIAQQSKFTGSVSLFDEDRGKMRSLELISLTEEVRRLGTLHISRAEFKDQDSGQKLGVDITVENQKGALSVQSLRIREVIKP